MTRWKKLIVLPSMLAALLATIACLPHMPGTPDVQPSLEDTAWVLRSLGQPGSLSPALENTEVTLVFSGDSQAGGNAGCNTYGGSYQSDRDGSLSFTDLFHTEMYCMEPGVMDQEQLFLNALQGATQYEVVNDALRISGDGVLLVLARS